MTKILKYIIILGVFIGLFSACTKENAQSSDAQPTVKYIRYTDQELSDQLVTSGAMGETIAIIGENLEGVCKITFNGLDAKLNPTLVTPTTIIAEIPSSMPEDVTNEMVLTTKNGKETIVDFNVIIPSPVIKSISCEWAMVGTKATLTGDLFFARADGTIDVIFPGNIKAEVTSITNTSIEFIVPEGAAKGNIVVENDYGKGRSQFIYKDDSGIFVDTENPLSWNNWGQSDFATEGGIDGQYIKLKGETGNWSWPANNIQMFYIRPDGSSIVSEGEVADYALRFEANVLSWKGTNMLIWFDAAPDEMHNADGSAAQYHWRPYLTAPGQNYVTDGWITVTMPLSEFVYSKDELEINRKINTLSDLKNLNFLPFGAIETDNTDLSLEMWIDNIRLVKIK